jgi:hypothetical protein
MEWVPFVAAVDGATHAPKYGVEGIRGSLKNGTEVFMLFPRDAQLVQRSSVLTVLDPNEVDVTLKYAENFRSVLRLGKVALLVACGAAEMLLVSLNCPLSLLRSHPPT